MRTVISFLILLLTLGTASANDYQEGEHYKKITPLPVNGPEVREFFSFYCGHCYRFEFMVKSIKENLPEGAAFVKNHVNFLGGASKKMQGLMTKALVVAEKMEGTDANIAAIFKYIHVHRAVPTSEKDIRNVFVLNGADGAKFDALMASEEVQQLADTMHEYQNTLASKGELKSVPSVVVNGKYMIDVKHLDKDNFQQDYNNLVKYLLELK
ncbi:thiol:disulfide interchange protein DsbA/DsbL [Thalassotalea marina]|uniref:Thiol:disulfide interchange protein n=1 Tax=Thalassotalea marina TaxID=1673741 RepID=A0A919BNN2_9GAMM|nr:thiol:disulfide interchange protein DsbA/DsbL [Thalassotalea marina]GHF99592.1 thiol:disulfide interchange protein DsbA [Thalassotalea marina]